MKVLTGLKTSDIITTQVDMIDLHIYYSQAPISRLAASIILCDKKDAH